MTNNFKSKLFSFFKSINHRQAQINRRDTHNKSKQKTEATRFKCGSSSNFVCLYIKSLVSFAVPVSFGNGTKQIFTSAKM